MRHLLSLALFTLAAAVPNAAWAQHQGSAQPSAADRTTARRLGMEGQIALKKSDFDLAADRFERANDLVPAPSFLVRLARARIGQGRLVEAYEIYRTIIREGVGPDKPDPFKRALAEAQQEVKGLEPRLAWVSVDVVGVRPDQAQVSLNGSVIPSAALGAQRPMDPGLLHVEAKADGYRSAEAEMQLSEGQHVPVIELHMVALPKAPSVAVEVAETQPVMSADGGGEAGFMSQSTLGYVALGLGGIGLGVGGVTGLIAMNRRSELDDVAKGCRPTSAGCEIYDPDNSEHVRAVKAHDDLKTFANAATIGFIAGGALAATGLLLLITAPDESASSASIYPYVGLGSIGAVGTF